MRKSFITLAVMLLAVSAFAKTELRRQLSSNSTSLGCLLYVDGALYTLNDLKHDSDYSIPVESMVNTNVSFQACQTVKTPCEGGSDAYAVLRTTDGQGATTECKSLTSADSADVNIQVLQAGNTSSGVNLTYINGDVVQGQDLTNYSMSFELQLKCNKEMNESINFQRAFQNGADHPYRYTVMAESKYACPGFDASEVWAFVAENAIVFAGVFMSIGVFVCFFGKRFITITLFLAGFCLVFGAIMALSFAYVVKDTTGEGLKWTLVGLSAVLGMLFGFGISRQMAQKAAMFLLGAILGVVIGSILFSTWFVKMEFAQNNVEFFNIATMAIFGLVFAVMGAYLTDFIEILSTSFFGSYMTFRILGVLLGGYPDVQELANKSKNSAYGDIPVQFYFYLAGTIIMAIVGMYHQCKHHQENKDKEQQNEDSNVYAASYDKI